MTENSDAALLNCVETRGQREQRALSRAIEAKENGKCGWRNREGHVDERLTRPITMAHALDRQRGRVDCCHCVHLRWMFESRTGDRAGCFGVEYACRGWRWGSYDRVAASYDCPGLAERDGLRRAHGMGLGVGRGQNSADIGRR